MSNSHTLFRTVRTASLALVLAGAVAGSADAQERYRSNERYGHSSSNEHWIADGQLVDVQVQVQGQSAPLFFRPGRHDRHYFQAFRGQNYALVLRNTTGRRVGVVISVDGLNVVSGERSSLSRNESMYVLNPHERAVIRGWRSSLDEIRRFVFVDEQHSYAERTGQANGDMGWIRVATFREDAPVSIWTPWNRSRDGYRDGARPYDKDGLEEAPPQARRENAAPESQGSDRAMGESYAPGAPQSAPGTGWGDRRHDRVEQTHFRAERHATDQIVMRYEYASGLRALGIIPQRSRVWDRERGELGFAQPPRW